jgi:hypothetical protein
MSCEPTQVQPSQFRLFSPKNWRGCQRYQSYPPGCYTHSQLALVVISLYLPRAFHQIRKMACVIYSPLPSSSVVRPVPRPPFPLLSCMIPTVRGIEKLRPEVQKKVGIGVTRSHRRHRSSFMGYKHMTRETLSISLANPLHVTPPHLAH